MLVYKRKEEEADVEMKVEEEEVKEEEVKNDKKEMMISQSLIKFIEADNKAYEEEKKV